MDWGGGGMTIDGSSDGRWAFRFWGGRIPVLLMGASQRWSKVTLDIRIQAWLQHGHRSTWCRLICMRTWCISRKKVGWII